MVKLKAVVDSSFWININKTGLVKYLFEYFELYFTEKVEDELSDYKDTRGSVPKDLDVFLQLKNLDFVSLKNPRVITKRQEECLSKNSGEIQTIALAEEINAIVLVDDYGPVIFCDQNNITHLTSVTFIAMLYKKNKISRSEERRVGKEC